MNIIITLAGHSRRFKAVGYTKPKFLIEIHGNPILNYVVDMFSQEDHFYFVANHEQLCEYPELKSYLETLAKKTTVILIDTHELGPAHSALQAKELIADKEPVIVSYCDFLVDWEYQKFLYEVSGFDSAIPSFSGMHPASFGETYYAYMRVNQNQELLELREKQSFTDKRHEEPASAGIYYFRTWSIFEKYANKLLEKRNFFGLKEAYVSLLANLMIEDDLKIKVTKVNQFICLGTPKDLEQYAFWVKYFLDSKKAQKKLSSNKQVNLIPMAGRGKRFRDYGYHISKPLITVKNRPMIVTACESFPKAQTWCFLAQKEDLIKHPIEKTVQKVSASSKVIPVDGVTSGQAATCLLAEKYIEPENPLFIASCDYESNYDNDVWNQIVQDKSIDGAIWTFQPKSMLTKDPNAFAWCVTDPSDPMRVTHVVEKKTISDHPENDPLVIGSFWFRRGKDFIYAAKKAIEVGLTVNGEHYVGTSINLLLEKGMKFVIFPVEQWISFGDPFELEVYNYWEEYYQKRESLLHESSSFS